MRRPAGLPAEELRSVVVKLTSAEFETLCKVARVNRRQPGPQAAAIVAAYLKKWEELR